MSTDRTHQKPKYYFFAERIQIFSDFYTTTHINFHSERLSLLSALRCSVQIMCAIVRSSVGCYEYFTRRGRAYSCDWNIPATVFASVEKIDGCKSVECSIWHDARTGPWCNLRRWMDGWLNGLTDERMKYRKGRY